MFGEDAYYIHIFNCDALLNMEDKFTRTDVLKGDMSKCQMSCVFTILITKGLCRSSRKSPR